MPGFLVEAFAAALQPPDTRPIWEWAEEHIRIPNSARTRNFHRDTAPWMNEPLERSCDAAVRRLVILGPTGGSKTTLADVRVPYGIATGLGSMLLSQQSDADADEYCEERLMPILDECEPVRALAPAGVKGRHKLKKNQRIYPHCSLFVGGAGKSNAQRKSVQWVDVDEAWLVKRGMLAEFEKRTHDRWNGQLCVMSQGGNEGEELDEFWKLTDMAEWSWECPACRHVQPFKWGQVWYEKKTAADGALDLNATAATARMLCARTGKGCVAFLPDEVTTRRALAQSGRYVSTNPKALTGHFGRHFNALTLYWLSWGKLVTEWVQAREELAEGDPTNFIIFIQKRLAEAYRKPKKTAAVVLTAAKYKLADYWEPGTKIDGEVARIMAIDVQQGHWWVLVRALRANGTSRLLYASKVTSEQMMVHLQDRFQVKPGCVLVDCNYEPGLVFNMCARHGWTAVEGDKSQGYPQTVAVGNSKHKVILRYYSQPNDTAAPEGGVCKRILFSRVKVTDETVKWRDNPKSGWEHGEDTPEDWHKHALSEEKIETRGESGKPTYKYERIKKRRNDLWWCEVAVTLGAIILGILRPVASEVIEVDSPSEVGGVEQPGSS